MNEARKMYAIGSGIVAAIVVLALALMILNQNQGTMKKQVQRTQPRTTAVQRSQKSGTIQNVVRIPDSDTVKQTLKIKR